MLWRIVNIGSRLIRPPSLGMRALRAAGAGPTQFKPLEQAR